MWADAHPDTVHGDATALPFIDGAFHAAVTSPTYGNRLADSHRAKDGSRRNSYTHNLRALTGDEDYVLDDNNTGKLRATSAKYWDLHVKAYVELSRVLDPDDGVIVLNTSDHIASGEVVQVTIAHHAVLVAIGWNVAAVIQVATPRLRYGANSAARVAHEDIAIFVR